jgi:hypothetical protein
MRSTRFAHRKLDAFHVARSALVAGDAIRKLPRGYGPLANQMPRALLGAYLELGSLNSMKRENVESFPVRCVEVVEATVREMVR